MNEDFKVREILEQIRAEGTVPMGVCKAGEEVPCVTPKIAVVSPPVDQTTLSGDINGKGEPDLVVRFISDAQPHRAIPLTGVLCIVSAVYLSLIGQQTGSQIGGSEACDVLGALASSNGIIKGIDLGANE
jgi:2-methylaconitate cis-trans-isomerase PrpF